MRSFAVALLCALLAAGCYGGTPDRPPATTTGDPPTATTPGGTPTPEPGPELSFDGARALALVEEQVRRPDGSVRYRVPGTEGNRETAVLVSERLREHGFSVAWHHFNATYGCERTPMHNVVGERPGSSGKVVVFAAHYDTRPVADKDPDPANRDKPIPGANDGASGVAVLLELARVMPPTRDAVRIVFFDGEDGGGYKGRECTDWILGSRAYAASLSEAQLASVRAFVLVDMIGDPRLELPREGYSRTGPGKDVLAQVWDTARRLGHRQFLDRDGTHILDDHVPFIEKGVPAIDLIHLTADGRTFPSWHHTMADDVGSVSAESLAAVGRTLERWVHDA